MYNTQNYKWNEIYIFQLEKDIEGREIELIHHKLMPCVMKTEHDKLNSKKSRYNDLIIWKRKQQIS